VHTSLHTIIRGKKLFLLSREYLAIVGRTSSLFFALFLRITALYESLGLLLPIMLPQIMFFVDIFKPF
jgi:hypothetical protein